MAKRFNEYARQDTIIGRAIRKHGKENFRYGVIKSCASKSEMDYWEKFFIKTLKTKSPSGYNLTEVGGGIVGLKRKGVSKSLQHCANISAGQRRNSPFKNLTAEIDKMNLTYTSLTRLLGLTRQNISRKILGQWNFTEKDKVKLAGIFGKLIEFLRFKEEF